MNRLRATSWVSASNAAQPASAVAAVERRRRAAPDDPARHGPAYGLLMAWRARLLVEIGKPDLARDLADRAVRHLSAYSDDPPRIQAPLLVALAVLQRAAITYASDLTGTL